jgi:branched-subunit amino acid aminotransferase/4-amino-4-deoxychorismate lyase
MRARDAHLIETIRIRAGVAPLWYLHLRRLATSCQALGVPLPGELSAPEGGEDRVCRYDISRRGVDVIERPVGSTAPVRLITSRVVHRPYPHKTTDRTQFEQAQAEARAVGADDALLATDGLGYAAETAIWGLFWWESDRLCAPPLDLGILPGVARARLAELMGPILERRVTPEALEGRSLFVANAARGVVPVAEFEARSVLPSPATAALAERFWS